VNDGKCLGTVLGSCNIQYTYNDNTYTSYQGSNLQYSAGDPAFAGSVCNQFNLMTFVVDVSSPTFSLLLQHISLKSNYITGTPEIEYIDGGGQFVASGPTCSAPLDSSCSADRFGVRPFHSLSAVVFQVAVSHSLSGSFFLGF
jgi:hypothetical protein